MKVGTPTDDELEELGRAIADSWRELGRRLGVPGPVLYSIDKDFEKPEKGISVLIHWKQFAAASYKVLNDALRDEDIQRQDLAEKFCQPGRAHNGNCSYFLLY